ncbi:MAG: hypothetical protein AB1806_14790 [Acidobacteriota bacterium]
MKIRHGVVAGLVLCAVTASTATPGARQNAYAGLFTHPVCSPGIVFTVRSMSWNLDYVAGSNFGGMGPCFMPDLSDLLGTWEMIRQEVNVGTQILLSNVAGKQLKILPRAVFELDPALWGVMAQEEWLSEKFCTGGATASPGCKPLPAMLSPDLPTSALPIAPCRESAVFRGLVRSDVYLQSGVTAAGQPVPPFTVRTTVREDLQPISIRCPGADVDVVCRNCASQSVGKLQMVFEYDLATDALRAVHTVSARTLVQHYKRLSKVTLDSLFNADGSLK